MSSPSNPVASTAIAGWSLQAGLLVSHVGLASVLLLVFGTLLLASSLQATYQQAETDLLAVARELSQDLLAEPAPTELTISELYRHRLGMAPRDRAYIALWDATGRRVYATPSIPGHVRPGDRPLPEKGPRPYLSRATGPYLDVLLATPEGGQLLVGRPLAKEWDALYRLALRALALGGACLAGGWVIAVWLSRRLSRPLTQLTGTAEQITGRRLHERIVLREGSQEILRLGQVFNAMLEGLQSAFEKQTRFVADASHELRTPVSVILSQVEHALHRERTPEEYRAALVACRRSSRRMKGLIQDLLFLARADAGRLELRTVATDLAHVATQAVELLRPLAREQAVQLETELTAAPLTGDPERLEQVLVNLITNAIRYNRPEGRVLVTTKLAMAIPDGPRAVLEVRDTGIGISPEDQPRLFDRFYRVDTARTQQDETSTGLGLSLVHEIVMAHRGTIEVQSEPGVGTTMIVGLPGGSGESVVN